MQRLDIKRTLSSRSDRVKSVDIHPTEPWVLASLYNGHIYLWNYSTQELVKSFEVTDLPVRAARFVARKQWLLAGADDMQIRVYNYNTMEKVKSFEAHSDYIRSLAVHPTQPFVLSSSDDMLIKLWDWEKGWQCTQIFEGHSHYVMMVVFNPKDTNTFASASLDRSVKVWGLGSPAAHFTLEGHEKGVNAVDYYLGGDKPYLITGSDDRTVKVWDYHHKSCVQTLEGHTNNVSVVGFHPSLNLIISGSEDGTLRLWHGNTYRLEKTLNYGLERVWALNLLKGTNKVAIGYDEGTVVIKLASEAPAVSMDVGGKIIWARQNEVQSANLKAAASADAAAPAPADGERLPLSVKDLGTSEFYPAFLQHNNNGRFVVVCGDGEYVIYTALAWRNKTFGSAAEFVWGVDTGEYATRESNSKIKTFENFKETRAFRPSFNAEGIFGGALLGVRSTQFVCFYDWKECKMVRRIDVVPHAVYWSENGELLTIACEGSFYILKYSREKVQKALESGAEVPEEGFEFAFDVLHEVNERVRTAHWVGDCFIYTNANGRLNYCVGGEVATIAHLDRKLYLLGYIPRDGRLYLIDKQLNVVSYALHLGIINYQTHVLRGDIAAADEQLKQVPREHHNRIAQFLEAQGMKEKALTVAIDTEYRLDLALQLGRLDMAHELALDAQNVQKWRQLGDLALAAGRFSLAEECLSQSADHAGLLLLYTCLGSGPALEALADMARESGKANIAFVCYFLLQRLEQCVELLVSTGRIPEAAFFARTYLPSQVSGLVKLWRENLSVVNQRAAEALADPMQYENLFPDLAWALKAEELLRPRRKTLPPAAAYPQLRDELLRDLIAELKATGSLAGATAPAPAPTAPAAAPSSSPAPTPAPATTPAPAPAPATAVPKPAAAVAPTAAPATPSPPSASPPAASPQPAPPKPAAVSAPAPSSPAPSSPAPAPAAAAAPQPKPAAAAPAPASPAPAAAVAPASASPAPAPAPAAAAAKAPAAAAAKAPAAAPLEDEEDFEDFLAKAGKPAAASPSSPSPSTPTKPGSPAVPSSPAAAAPAKPPAAASTTFDDLLNWGDDEDGRSGV